ncbi:peptidase family C78-domain-containing protein [Dunaliella salina]|uniref:Peptidase family C78-domain-containing protein n=1 Tax=Dunaliella salina TaxID=3046 RepID=A0ABQ7GR71_DUNSA|nr:peptidase family C78-domain-containing protein [Dunaliella salina]|eukprot:KAF5837111.1 peptidase family C78-domain-containing protein [Dunaliella salina]
MPNLNCPICGASSFKSVESCQRHVDGCAERPAASTSDETVQCPYGCGAWVPLAELNDHELAHQRAQAGATSDAVMATAAEAAAAADAADAAAAAAAQAQLWEDDQGQWDDSAGPKSAEALARELQEQQDFEALRRKYGFEAEKKPGQCWHCGGTGHWSNACPRKHARPLLSIDPCILITQQQPELQYHPAPPPKGQQVKEQQQQQQQQQQHHQQQQQQQQHSSHDERMQQPEHQPPFQQSCSDTMSLAMQQQQQQQQQQQLLQHQGITSASGSTHSPYLISPNNPDIVELLKPCLIQHSTRAPTYCALLSGPVHHLCSSRQDQGWGCGWRNIQMQISHLLARGFQEQLPHCSSQHLYVDQQQQHLHTDQQQRASGLHLSADQQCFPAQHGGPNQHPSNIQQHGPFHSSPDPLPSTSQHRRPLNSFPNQLPSASQHLPGQWQASSPGMQIRSPCLFGSNPILPDIGSLQAWLEAAWSEGFDTAGAESLGGKIQGDHKWIGTTEACALLRHQGVRAEIIDFMGRSPSAAALPDGRTVHSSVACDLCGACPIIGVRHRSLSRTNYDLCSRCAACPAGKGAEPFEMLGTGPLTSGTQAPLQQQHHQQQQQQPPENGCESNSSSSSGSSESSPFHLPLIEWVWNYFSGSHPPTRHMHHQIMNGIHTSSIGNGSALAHTPLARLGGAAPPPPVLSTGLPPLYFQHDGHSRTIIGIERTRKPPAQQPQQPLHQQKQALRKREAPEQPSSGGNNGSSMGEEGSACSLVLRGGPATFDASRYTYTLLVLDPGIPTSSIVSSLRAGSGWQRFIRRGLHTLRHSQYQLLVCVLEEEGQQRSAGLARQIRALEVVCS